MYQEYIKLAPVIFVRLINIYLTPPQNQSCRSHVQVPFYAQQKELFREEKDVSHEPSLNHGAGLCSLKRRTYLCCIFLQMVLVEPHLEDEVFKMNELIYAAVN